MILMKLINWNFCGIYIQHRLYFSERCGFWKIISCIIKCRIYSDIDFRCFKPKENYTRSELLAWKFSILQSKENVSLSTLIWLSDAVHTLLICRSIISYLNFQDLLLWRRQWKYKYRRTILCGVRNLCSIVFFVSCEKICSYL